MCKSKNPKCVSTGGKCSTDLDINTVKCDCPADIPYNKNTGCNFTDEMCKSKNPKCVSTGGKCSVNRNTNTAKCDCPADITYNNNTGCNVTADMCKNKNPKCLPTGGKCSVDRDRNTVKCDCPADISYNNKTGCNVTDDLCKSEKPNCTLTGGSCSVDRGTNSIKCNCPVGSTYNKTTGCNVNFCLEVCGEKPGVVCKGEKTKKDSIKCSCEDEEKIFDKKIRECKKENVICDSDSDCKNGGSCKEKDSEKYCACLEGTEGPICEKVAACTKLGCGTNASCTFNIERKAAECQCEDEKMLYDTTDKICKSKNEKKEQKEGKKLTFFATFSISLSVMIGFVLVIAAIVYCRNRNKKPWYTMKYNEQTVSFESALYDATNDSLALFETRH